MRNSEIHSAVGVGDRILVGLFDLTLFSFMSRITLNSLANLDKAVLFPGICFLCLDQHSRKKTLIKKPYVPLFELQLGHQDILSYNL